MNSYYNNQAKILPHFCSQYRQRGRGFGALASGVGRVALALARQFILPTAKHFGKKLLRQSDPELLDVVSSKKKISQTTLKNTISNTVKKQTGDQDFANKEKSLRVAQKNHKKNNHT